ncbi:MAG: cytochrome c family protein, partial [Gammaproteobacteria bacterium]|nr:cytochrome c family protein [Gammaproteobacteria bacterium]
PPPKAPHEVSSKLCSSCHVQIYKEWEGSMHAQSTALKDPIHGAFYRKVIGDPTKEGVTKKDKYPVCLRCHAPNAAIQGKTKLDAKPAFKEGVNCILCHTIDGFKGTLK